MADENTRERDPVERKTLEDALRIATTIVDDVADLEPVPLDADEVYTLAAGFLVLCGDMAAMLDAAKKATHFCGWCEQANNNSRIGLTTYTLDEVREHTVRCEHNPVVRQLRAMAAARDEACELADEANGDPSECMHNVMIGERIVELRKVGTP